MNSASQLDGGARLSFLKDDTRREDLMM